MELQQFILVLFGYNVCEWFSKWGYKYSSILSLAPAENLWTDSGPQNPDLCCLHTPIDFSNFFPCQISAVQENLSTSCRNRIMFFFVFVFVLEFGKAVAWLSIKWEVIDFIFFKNLGQKEDMQCLRRKQNALPTSLQSYDLKYKF